LGNKFGFACVSPASVAVWALVQNYVGVVSIVELIHFRAAFRTKSSLFFNGMKTFHPAALEILDLGGFDIFIQGKQIYEIGEFAGIEPDAFA
jgi:hypothetical protein